MKKLYLFLLLAVVALLASCESNYDKYPFKDVSVFFSDLYQTITDNPEKIEKRDFQRSFREKEDALLKALEGRKIRTEIKDGLGFEVVSNEAVIGKVDASNLFRFIHIHLSFDLKVKDVVTASENINKLSAVLYDDEDNAVYGISYIGNGQFVNTDTIEIDELHKANQNDIPDNIIHGKIDETITFISLTQFYKITKMVVEEFDSDRLYIINYNLRNKEKEFLNQLRGE